MWILYAFASAFFAGVTAVLAKLGMEGVNSHLATALRTIVVALFGWAMGWVARSSLERSTRWPPWINPALC